MNNSNYFSNTILSWFQENGRDLPWRETKNPYSIWLSEVILQQTRIAQGWEYWERFMSQYPTVNTLAAANEDDVLKLWQGLGYYSRARNLHAAAKQIVAFGKFPDTLADIRSLKGVGDYTAAAIASFAFDIPAAVVDGNVYRVLSRYYGIDTPINSTAGKKEFAALAQSLLPPLSNEKIRPNEFGMALSTVSAYNQGMMDFGAIQCTSQSPKCLICPLAETCEALRNDKVQELPVKNKILKVKTRHLTYIYIRCTPSPQNSTISEEPKVAFHRRGEGDIWQGLWEPFIVSTSEDKTSVSIDEIENALRMIGLKDVTHLHLLVKDIKHVLTHQILLADFYVLETSQNLHLPDNYVWIKESEIENYGVPKLIEIMLNQIKKYDTKAPFK